MTTFTREGLERSVPFHFRANDGSLDGDGLTLSGHAAVFNQTTRIDSWEGTFDEEIAPGAFRKTIRERTPVLQFDHGRHPLVGSIPIGSIETLNEDTEGLFVEARMADNWLIEPVRDAIKNKSVKGMSFRFEVIRERWEDNAGKEIKDPEELRRLLWGYEGADRLPLRRTLKELKVSELGPVVFPAYEGTSVDVRSQEVANLVMTDPKTTRLVRASLVRNQDINFEREEYGHELGQRRQIARAILFGDKPANAVDGHLEPKIDVVEVEPSITDTQPEMKDDAPITPDHPSRQASDDFKTRMQYTLRKMNRRLDTVNEEMLGVRTGEAD